MKKQTLLLKIYAWALLLTFGLIVFHAPLSVGLGSVFPEQQLLIKSWKEILLLLFLPAGVWLAVRAGLAKKMRRDYLFLAIVAYAGLHLISLIFSETSLNQILSGLAIDLRFMLFFVLMFIAASLEPSFRQKALLIGLLATVVSIGFSLLQVFILPRDILTGIGYGSSTIEPYLTIDKNPDFVRINGTMRGPNPLGAYALTVISLVAAWLAAGKQAFKRRDAATWLAVLGLASVIVLWASYSRSALVATLVSLAIIVLVVFLKRVGPTFWLGLLAGFVLFFGLVFSQKDSHLAQNVLLHKNPAGGSMRDSNQEHASSLQKGVERLLSQPFGAGIGSTGSASLFGEHSNIIENQYLYVAHETGWLGLILFIFIYLSILWRLLKQKSDWLALGVLSSGLGLLLVGFLLPVWADDAVSIIWWGLAGIALATGGKYAKRKSTK